LIFLVPIFNQYRVFYKQISNIEVSNFFLKDRIQNNESVFFLSLDENNKGTGFTQLYPVFSSVSMKRFYILNDLFVVSEYRNKGIGEALLNKAKELCKLEECKGLALETALENPAKKLYERLNWKKEKDFFHYFWNNEKF